MNRSHCNSCGDLVTAQQVERDGKVYLEKDCPECGQTETLIASDAERYYTKRSLDGEHEDPAGCMVRCLECPRKNQPSFVFLDITNRCNSNCPICINNTPSMGFLFEPPLEYFDKIFEYFSTLEPRPAVQLFGGEPTVRKDLFEIIDMARSYGLRVRVVTNGIKLADEDYCRRLVETRTTILMAYDGHNPETYRVLRGSERYLDIKRQALDNLEKMPRAKVALMTCVAHGFNEDEMPDLLALCHERRSFVRGVYFLPLAETWNEEELDVHPPRMTTEDLEMLLDDAFPDERIDFVPAGVLGELRAIMDAMDTSPPPFSGAHPNCESMYLLVSDGEKFVPLARYLKGTLPELIEDLLATDRKVARRMEKLEGSAWGRLLEKVRLKKAWVKGRTMGSVFRTVRRHLSFGKILRGRGPGKLWHLLCIPANLLTGARSRQVFERHTTWQGQLQLITLPFEDNANLETERLERCPNAFAFYDPEAEQVNYVPTCAWGHHKTETMRRIAEYYEEQQEPTPAPTA